jgi:hypothetical protein
MTWVQTIVPFDSQKTRNLPGDDGVLHVLRIQSKSKCLRDMLGYVASKF